jgi:hypothetical protein
MKSKTKSTSPEPLSPVVDISKSQPAPKDAEFPDVVIVFELDQQQYAAARKHLDHLIDKHKLSAHVHFEEQI